jgi:hypothetical protein
MVVKFHGKIIKQSKNMTAKEANQRTRQTVDASNEIKKIKGFIEEAADAGQYEFNYTITNNSTRLWLNQMGYCVEPYPSPDDGSICHTISWKNAQ